MDVSGWTIDQRMRLPDWCFGNRHFIMCNVSTGTTEPFQWGISEFAFPDPACIWLFDLLYLPFTDGKGYVRVGMADAVPTSEAEMDAAAEIFPGYGFPNPGPNVISVWQTVFIHRALAVRKGLVTGGKKLVVETYRFSGSYIIDCSFLVSELPTSMAGWLVHNK